jgi:hypothetical protein
MLCAPFLWSASGLDDLLKLHYFILLYDCEIWANNVKVLKSVKEGENQISATRSEENIMLRDMFLHDQIFAGRGYPRPLFWRQIDLFVPQGLVKTLY